MEIRTPNLLPHALHVPVPGFRGLGPVNTFIFIGRDKTRTKGFNNKNNNNKNKELSLSLGHIWVIQQIKEVKLDCMAAAEGRWETPSLHCGFRGRSRRRLKLGGIAGIL